MALHVPFHSKVSLRLLHAEERQMLLPLRQIHLRDSRAPDCYLKNNQPCTC